VAMATGVNAFTGDNRGVWEGQGWKRQTTFVKRYVWRVVQGMTKAESEALTLETQFEVLLGHACSRRVGCSTSTCIRPEDAAAS
jgi:hypothetical protein